MDCKMIEKGLIEKVVKSEDGKRYAIYINEKRYGAFGSTNLKVNELVEVEFHKSDDGKWNNIDRVKRLESEDSFQPASNFQTEFTDADIQQAKKLSNELKVETEIVKEKPQRKKEQLGFSEADKLAVIKEQELKPKEIGLSVIEICVSRNKKVNTGNFCSEDFFVSIKDQVLTGDKIQEKIKELNSECEKFLDVEIKKLGLRK